MATLEYCLNGLWMDGLRRRVGQTDSEGIFRNPDTSLQEVDATHDTRQDPADSLTIDVVGDCVSEIDTTG